jgi:hypothetical protein
MRVKLLVGLGALLAFALPAQARAGSFTGVVVAKQAGGTLVLAAAHGRALTVHSTSTRVRVGDRVRAQSLSGSRVVVLGHVHRTTIRGTVVRRLSNATLLAAGHSVIRIYARGSRRLASGNDNGGLQPGDIGQFQVGFDSEGDMVQVAAPIQVGQSTSVQIDVKVVSVSPFVVSLEGLPVAITVPAGMTLPTLAVGDEIELTVQVTVGTNTFTLVSMNGGQQNGDEQDQDDNGDNGDNGGGQGGGGDD